MSRVQQLTDPTPARIGEGREPRGAQPLDRLLQDWRGALERAARYLRALGFTDSAATQQSRAAAERALAAPAGVSALDDTLDASEALLREAWPLAPGGAADDAFARWRRAWWQAGAPAHPGPLQAPESLTATPPLLRGAMVPERYRGRRLGEWRARPYDDSAERGAEAARAPTPRWRRRGRIRRTFLA